MSFWNQKLDESEPKSGLLVRHRRDLKPKPTFGEDLKTLRSYAGYLIGETSTSTKLASYASQLESQRGTRRPKGSRQYDVEVANLIDYQMQQYILVHDPKVSHVCRFLQEAVGELPNNLAYFYVLSGPISAECAHVASFIRQYSFTKAANAVQELARMIPRERQPREPILLRIWLKWKQCSLAINGLTRSEQQQLLNTFLGTQIDFEAPPPKERVWTGHFQ